MNETVPNAYPRYRWYILALLCIITAASTVIMISPAPLMGVIADHFKISLGDATGQYMGVFNLFVAISCVIGGIVCDKKGFTPVFLFTVVMLTLPTLAIPFVGDSIKGLLLVRVLHGLACGPILAAVSPVAAVWFPLNERGIVTGFQGMSVSLGIAIGFIAGPAAYGATGSWLSSMTWMAVAPLLAALAMIAVFSMKKPPVPVSEGMVYENSHQNAHDTKLAFRQSATWVGVFIVFAYMWILNAFNDLTPAYLAVPSPLGMGFGPMKAGQYMLALEIAYMVGSVTTGFVMERIFRGRVKPVMAMGFGIFAAFAYAIILPTVTSSQAILLSCLIVAGFFQAWIVPNAMAFVALHYPPHITGKIVGMWLGIGIFGGTAGVLAGAAALKSTGDYHMSVLLVALVSFAGLVATLLLRAPKVFGLGKNA